jgi:large subunit ribosomal protein L10e
MAERPGRCYRKVEPRAYTRTSKHVAKKSYIKGVPASKLTQLDMGNSNKSYRYEIDLIVGEDVQVRSNALESARVAVNKILERDIGVDNYHFQVRAYPHHVLRENAMITGAGADRLSSGMRHSFGKPVGRAARVKKGQVILSVKVNAPEHIDIARRGYKRATPKLPMPCTVRIKSGVAS